MTKQPLMAWAGFCRDSTVFGPVFAAMTITMTANEKVRPLNDRMPVLLKPDEYDRWLHGSIQNVIKIQFRDPPPPEDFEVLETRDRCIAGFPPDGPCSVVIMQPCSEPLGRSRMCSLYILRKSADEVARHFGVANPIRTNAPEASYPGSPGMVAIKVEEAREPKPVNNIADLSKPVWIGLARKAQWRCIIPLTAFAEAEGPKGAKTRTWLSLKYDPIFGWGGLWRVPDEWGPVNAEAMTAANDAVAPVHHRMPVLLHRDEYDRWMRGSFEDIPAIQKRVVPADLIDINRTNELWVRKKTGEAEAPRLL